jgi:hypothetical protein
MIYKSLASDAAADSDRKNKPGQEDGKMKTLFIMLSVCKTRAELCDLLTLASIAPITNTEFRTVYAAILERMKTI